MPQDVSAQDAIIRAKAQAEQNSNMMWVHREMTLERFIQLADKQDMCCNLLDVLNSQPDLPIFLRPLLDNMSAKSVIMNESYIPNVGANKRKAFYGVQTIQGDSERLQGWDLLTRGGFLTYLHHDAARLCTYVTVKSGMKIWGYIDTPGSSNGKQEELFKAWDKLFINFSK
ncbi:hypothetical protein OG21DRAFT_1488943 [Imleria badia]|nr:hypothetical protein OG21DRAFT_1488943 [Imleria badia]